MVSYRSLKCNNRLSISSFSNRNPPICTCTRTRISHGIGCVVLATILRNLGYGVRVMLEEVEDIDTNEFAEADLICISSLTSTAPGSYQYADFIRNVYPEKTIVMGGTHPTFVPDEALMHSDFVVRGEGEEALVELIKWPGIRCGLPGNCQPVLDRERRGGTQSGTSESR